MEPNWKDLVPEILSTLIKEFNELNENIKKYYNEPLYFCFETQKLQDPTKVFSILNQQNPEKLKYELLENTFIEINPKIALITSNLKRGSDLYVLCLSVKAIDDELLISNQIIYKK